MRGPRTAMKSGPHLPQLEKALAQKRGPNTAKNKFKKIYMALRKFKITYVAHVFLLAVSGLEGVRSGFEEDEMIQSLLRD